MKELTSKQCWQSVDSKTSNTQRLGQCILHGKVRYQVHGKYLLLQWWLAQQLRNEIQTDVHGWDAWYSYRKQFSRISLQYELKRNITMFTKPVSALLSWVRWIQYTPTHPVSIISISVLFHHICLGQASSLFPSSFQQFCTNFSHLPCIILYALPILSFVLSP